MGRPRKGSVTPRGNAWRASVPHLDPNQGRLETTFSTEKAAQAWVKAQLARLDKGLEPQLPRRQSGAGLAKLAPTTFSEVAWRWYNERYVALERGEGDRKIGVRDDLRLHVIPAFADLFTLDVLEGRARIIDWLRVRSGRKPLSPGSPLLPGKKTYSKTTVTGFLWILKEVIAYARQTGLDVPEYVAKEDTTIAALKPVGRRKRKPQLLLMAEAPRFAACLHWIHQFGFWLMRLAGMRISEAYGLYVESFIRDIDGDGFLRVKDQGGRTFFVVTEDGDIEPASVKEGGKSDAAFRLIALPRLLTEMIAFVIDTFHTDDDGIVDVKARLIPAIQSETGGQDGFRSALKKAALEIGVAEGDEDVEVLLIPHDLRKAYSTDLAWNPGVSGLLARRALGHRAGSDVFDLVYTLDPRLKAAMLPVAWALDEELEREGVSTLMVPMALRPLFGGVHSQNTIARLDAELAQIGWQVPADPETITAAEAAVLLGYTEKHTRRLMGVHIAAVKTKKSWSVRVEDVLAFRDRLDGKVLLREVAVDAGVPYRMALRHLQTLGITPGRDTYDERVIVMTVDEAAVVISHFEQERERGLHSVTRMRAAEILGVTPSTVEQLLLSGHLVAHEDGCDGSGVRIAMDSIEKELSRRQRRGRSLTK